MKKTIWLLALTLSPASMLADEVILRSGGRISGVIVERSETSVTVDLGAGRMAVEMKYVERIEEGASALSEYRERAARLAPDDLEAWRELGGWATRQGLGSQAEEAYSQVLALAPDDPEANRALGLVQLDGRWVSEEESYLARGFVEFEGEWMTPDERDRILADRTAEERAEREALAAQMQIEAEAARAREAAEQAESEAWWDERGVYSEDTVYWNEWGVGPTYWPAQRPSRQRPATLPARGIQR